MSGKLENKVNIELIHDILHAREDRALELIKKIPAGELFLYDNNGKTYLQHAIDNGQNRIAIAIINKKDVTVAQIEKSIGDISILSSNGMQDVVSALDKKRENEEKRHLEKLYNDYKSYSKTPRGQEEEKARMKQLKIYEPSPGDGEKLGTWEKSELDKTYKRNHNGKSL